VAAQGLALLGSVVVARLLGREEFGRFDVVNGTVLMLGVFAGMGFGLTATKFVAQCRTSDPERAGRILGLSLAFTAVGGGVAALLLVLFARPLADQVLNAPALELPLKLAAALLFFTALGGMLNGALAGFEAFRAVAGVNVLRGALIFPLMLACAWQWGLPGAVLAQTLTSLAWCAAAGAALNRHRRPYGIRVQCRGLRVELPVLWSYSFPALLGGVLVTPFLWLASALLANRPGGYSDLGLLGAANQWRNVLMLLPTIFTNVTLPIIASGLETEGSPDTERVMEISQGLAILSVVPAVVALVFGSDLILRCYGRDFTGGVPLFALMTAGVGIAGIGNAGNAAIQAHGRMWMAVLMNLSWSAVYMAVVAALVGPWGGLALASGFLAAYAVLVAWGYFYIHRSGLVSRGMLTRTLGASAFLVAVTVPSAFIPTDWRLILLVPVLAVAVALSYKVWIDPCLREKIRERFR
jgi:O-antigen/teichoic acid export membrane protein